MPISRLPTACLAFASVVGGAFAGPAEDAIVAAMRLSEQANYSWTTTVTDDARTYDISGRTVPGGYTRVQMPVINSVRRRLGRSATDTQIDLIFRGNVDCVIATEMGWLRPDELPPAPADHEKTISLTRSETGRAGQGGSALPSLPLPPKPEDRRRIYSNLQLGVSHPHEELGIIVSSHAELAVEPGVVSGSLSDLGARLLLVRDGQKEITPLEAAGTFRLWIHQGMILKYQIRLRGLLQIDTGNSRQKILVNQTTDTVVKAIGTTVVDVPEQAREKLRP